MDKELFVRASSSGVDIALLEDKNLVELHHEDNDNRFSVGDIYLGRVKKLMPGLNAAFVDVGYKRDAFLHYTDLSPHIKSLLKFTKTSVHNKSENQLDFGRFKLEPTILKTGKITEVLNGHPPILVQILKEPISTKGPRLTCEISLPGRFIVLTPFNDMVAISKKIVSSAERKRLQKTLAAIKPKNFGVIVRTAAEGKTTAELHADLLDLTNHWKTITEHLSQATPPLKILSEQDRTTSILRDFLNESFHKIVVNNKEIYQEAKSYVKKIAPEKKDIVTLYENEDAIFDHYGITKQVKQAFGTTVNLSSGVYLIIEHTEALHVIDVNSGHKSSGNNQEQNALAANMEAAKEIARQLRLRDIGGIIIVDFIDMKLAENRKAIFKSMKDFMKLDRARHSVLPISRFGLLQITRQRVRPELNISTAELCPTCRGTGKVGSSILIADEIEDKVEYLINDNYKKLSLRVNPILFAYLKRGVPNKQWQWFRRFKKWITIKSDASYPLVQYTFFNKDNEEIKF